MSFSANDYVWMAQALKLAAQGLYTTTPNPRVGCVIVNNHQIVGEGAHLKAGEPHAEVHALKQAGALAQGATAYVTLEPCSHHGRTPPCAEALLHAGVARVVAAMSDPNPLVAGSGLALLQAQGIATEVGLMEAQARELNAGFISRMTRGMPWVRSKIASSLDGKTGLNNGQSQWITSEAARADVQHWRAQSCAILTGIGTVLADNPRLNVRATFKSLDGDDQAIRQPLRVVVDSTLKMPPDAAILQGGGTLIAFAEDKHHHASALLNQGAQLICLPNTQGQVCLKSLLQHLAQQQINEVLVEAGASLNGALLQQGLVDELLIYQAPILLGHHARGMLDFPALTSMQDKLQLQIVESRQVGVDTRIRAKLQC